MAELNGSERFLVPVPNATNQTLSNFIPNALCVGVLPSKVVMITTYSVLLILSLIGNSLIVAVFYRNRTLRTPVHYFIVNMAISDLLVPVVVLPGLIIETYYDNIWLVGGIAGTALCKIYWLASSLSTAVSILSMVVIAIDRFYAIRFAMNPALISRKSGQRLIIATWVAAVLFRAHYLYAARLVVRDNSALYCDFQWEPVLYNQEAQKITLISFLCLFIISAVLLTVFYASIITILYKQGIGIFNASEIVKLRAKENRRVTCMLVIVVVVFFAVWIPYHVSVFLYYLKNAIFPCLFLWFSHSLPVLCSIVNPVVYYTFNDKYRRGFTELLCCGLSGSLATSAMTNRQSPSCARTTTSQV